MQDEPFRPDMPPVSAASPAVEHALVRAARRLLPAGLVLALILALPSASFPLAAAKLALFSTLVGLAMVAAALGGAGNILARARGRLTLLACALLPAVYALSAWFSTDRSMALSGTGSETDTVLFVAIGFVSLFLAFVLIRTAAHLRALLLALAGAGALALLFQYVNILIGVPGAAFADASANLIGKWNDFGIVIGLMALLSLGALELMELSKRNRIVAWALLSLSLIMLGAVHFAVGWWMLLVAAAAIGTLRFVLRERAGDGLSAPPRRMPWAAGAATTVSIAFLLFGAPLNTALTSVLKVSSLEVRPAFSSTIEIGRSAHSSAPRVLLGSGPNTFNEAWLSYKPAEVNQTQFWSVDFATGFSLLSTAFVSVGYLGVIAWLLPMLAVLFGLLSVIRMSLSPAARALYALTGVAAAYLWSATILYAPSPDVVLLAFVLTGAFIGCLFAARGDAAPSRLSSFLSIGILIALTLLAVWAALAADRRFLAYAYSQQALVAAQGGDLDLGETLLSRSMAIERNGENLRLGVEISLARMQKIAQSTTTPAADAQAQFTAALQTAIADGQEAAALNPNDYRPYLELASVYGYLTSLNIAGARESEMAAYERAQALNQKNPAIPFFRAQLEAGNPQGSFAAVEGYITQSLQLKSNYTDALLFAVQLAVSQNDLATALKAQTAAVASAPDQAPLWYQLGLLYYVGGDMPNATAALEKALSIVPNYANVQYFLGLSYYRQGNTEGAIAQFTSLAANNPDNADVQKMLANLKAGKDPLAGIATPGAAASTAR